MTRNSYVANPRAVALRTALTTFIAVFALVLLSLGVLLAAPVAAAAFLARAVWMKSLGRSSGGPKLISHRSVLSH